MTTLLKAKKRTHGEFKRQVMRAVNRLPGVFVFPAGGGAFKIGPRFIRMGMVGVSDLIGWKETPGSIRVPGMVAAPTHFPVFVALECKRGKDKLSSEQTAFLEKVREGGGIAVEVRTIEDAVKALSL